jgi:prepilin-type N-terminal cleavage/methylation domain-containing protein
VGRLIVTHRKNQGFTLTEILIALVIAGILSALSLPSLLRILKGNEVKQAQDQIVATLRDAQKQAIRRSKKCDITINTGSNPVTITTKDTDDQGCLSLGSQILSRDITVVSNKGNDISYSFKGNTTNAKTLTISSNGTDQVRCIVISMHLGIMRSGIYEPPADAKSVSGKYCKTSTSTL